MQNSKLVELGKWQRVFLLIISIFIALALLFIRNGFQQENPLELLARNSLKPEIALNNNRPTIIEFYADWCEACQEMGPSILSLKERYDNSIDFVLLNVDNDKWLDLIDTYNVNGIPKLELFNDLGHLKGESIGLKDFNQLDQIALSLLNQRELPQINGVEYIDTNKVLFSNLNENIPTRNISPRSHG
ncbi:MULTISPECIES: thioredoxin domain-containing protein [unclassified Prochlorococcus]|uniref:thioredoxin domain-containing protein n=1 Tax=unclassified Prochlorococcus TaxID=2627481 RepID=UPI0005337683|nr:MULTISPECIES: thioredoxin domain-containing protein [unclassified Prochlorococcus]KGG16688.1 thioredoxin-like protein TxlA [Prochlorococcus sp. MIT 0602]KGG18340.1 thioredoxin-like protein TxlA [Prochlorococcus sp. MIT 0603]